MSHVSPNLRILTACHLLWAACSTSLYLEWDIIPEPVTDLARWPAELDELAHWSLEQGRYLTTIRAYGDRIHHTMLLGDKVVYAVGDAATELTNSDSALLLELTGTRRVTLLYNTWLALVLQRFDQLVHEAELLAPDFLASYTNFRPKIDSLLHGLSMDQDAVLIETPLTSVSSAGYGVSIQARANELAILWMTCVDQATEADWAG